MEIITKKLSELTTCPYNPRTITGEALAGLTASVTEWGCVQPIIWNKRTGNVVGGNQRLKVLRAQGDADTEVVVVDLPLSKEKALNIALNSSHIAGEWTPALGDLLDEIKLELPDLYEGLLLDDLLADVPEVELELYEGEADSDEIPAPVAEPVIQRGDLVTLGRHRLLCGDSCKAENVARLMAGSKADMVFTDPPYQIHNIEWDKSFDIHRFLFVIIDYMQDTSFFAFTIQMPSLFQWLNELKSRGLNYKDHIIWVKRITTAIAMEITRSHESLFIYTKGKPKYYQTKGLYSDVKLPGLLVEISTLESIKRYIDGLWQQIKTGKKRMGKSSSANPLYKYMSQLVCEHGSQEVNFTNVWSFLPDTMANTEQSEHPTQKPLKLITRGIELMTGRSGLVLDPFLGSGTTMIACETLGRTCYGMEIEPRYVQLATQRYLNFTGKPEDVTVERGGKRYKWGDLVNG